MINLLLLKTLSILFHLFNLLIPFHLPVLLLFNILPFLLLNLLFENPQGLVINLPICKLINATRCLIPLVLLSLCLSICPLINCLLDIPIFVICFPPLWNPSSITKQFKIPSGGKLWQLRFLPLKLTTLGPLLLFHLIREPLVVSGCIGEA